MAEDEEFILTLTEDGYGQAHVGLSNTEFPAAAGRAIAGDHRRIERRRRTISGPGGRLVHGRHPMPTR